MTSFSKSNMHLIGTLYLLIQAFLVTTMMTMRVMVKKMGAVMNAEVEKSHTGIDIVHDDMNVSGSGRVDTTSDDEKIIA